MTGLAIAGITAMVAGAGYSAYSQYQQGKAQEQIANAEAKEAEYQAELENTRAGIAQLNGEMEADKRNRQLAAEVGRLYSEYAGNGLLVGGTGEGDTFRHVLDSSMKEGASDVKTIKENAAMDVWNYEANRNSLLATAQNKRVSGKNAKRAGATGAAGTLMTGVGGAMLGGAGFFK